MSSKREGIILALKSALDSIGPGLPCFRSRVEPFTRGKLPALVIEPLQDKADGNVIGYLDWSLLVQVALYVRGDAPDMVADPHILLIHEKIMADQSLGGLSQDIQPESVEYDLIEGDKPVGVIMMKFLINYRTSEKNISA